MFESQEYSLSLFLRILGQYFFQFPALYWGQSILFLFLRRVCVVFCDGTSHFFDFFWDRTSLFFLFFSFLFEIGLCFPLLWKVGNSYFRFKSISSPNLRSDFSLSDLRSRRCPISKTKKKKGEKKQTQIKEDGKGHNSRNSGPTPVARGGSGAKAHPLAARPMSCPER